MKLEQSYTHPITKLWNPRFLHPSVVNVQQALLLVLHATKVGKYYNIVQCRLVLRLLILPSVTSNSENPILMKITCMDANIL